MRNLAKIFNNAEASEKRQKNFEFLRDALEHSVQPFGAELPDGQILYANAAFALLTGYSMEELQSLHSSTDLTPAEWREREAAILSKLITTGEGQTYEKEYIRKDGIRIPVEVRVHVNKNPRGTAEYFYAFVTDISERKQIEMELNTLSRQRQVALDAAMLGWWSYDPATKIARYDKRYTEIFDVSGDSKDVTEILMRIHPEDLPHVWSSVEKALDPKTATPYSVEYRILRDDGSVRWIAAHGSATFEGEDDARKATDFVGTVQDITESKQSSEISRLQLAEIEAIYDSAAVGLCVMDKDFKFARINSRMAEIHGLPAAYHIGKSFRQAIPAIADQAEALLKQIIETGKPFLDARFSAVSATIPAVERIWISQWVPVFGENGGIVGVNISAEEVTERIAANQALEIAKLRAEQANEAKDRFLAMLSHELRTPLTPIIAAAQLIERSEIISEKILGFIEVIKRNAIVEARLIDDLLDLNRIKYGKVSLANSHVSLHQVIERAVETCRSQAEEKRIQIEMVLNAENSEIIADATRLQQVLWNLLSNAIKFSETYGTIVIRTRTIDNKTIEASVIDQGRGISSELLEEVFEAFKQGNQDIGQRSGGLGLGLAISKGIVSLSGGTITARSAGIGRGCTMTIQLPLASDSGTLHQDEHSLQNKTKLKGKILLVEDHQDTSSMLEQILIWNGLQVVRAADVASAIFCGKREKFDLMICDLGLPDGSGINVLEGIGRENIRAIALSGNGTPAHIKACFEAGFEKHLLKPVAVERLEETLCYLLNSDPVA